MPSPPLVNRVAASGLITIRLEDYFPTTEIVSFDLKDYLFMELMLKEKDFRAALKAHDWSQYEGKVLLVYCSTDAIIPQWAYMLVAASAAPYAKDVFQGQAEAYYQTFYLRQIDQMDLEQYRDQRIVIKGCSEHPVPLAAYVELTRRLQPIARSLMYGEPCSTVPIYKRPRT
ncbi:MAG: DUF2480 family protein [Bacteroidetes bacterium]|nr:MAG: DUF2480 family protein [Bacteroidota bacterium]